MARIFGFSKYLYVTILFKLFVLKENESLNNWLYKVDYMIGLFFSTISVVSDPSSVSLKL
jgi:hypothetical protein